MILDLVGHFREFSIYSGGNGESITGFEQSTGIWLTIEDHGSRWRVECGKGTGVEARQLIRVILQSSWT